MANHQSLQTRSFYRSDPIASLLIKKLHLSPLSFGLLSVAISAGLYLLAAWVSNTLWSKPGQIGLLQDWLPWIWVLLINPVVLGYYLWSFQAISNVIQELEVSDVVETDTSEIDRIAVKPYKPKWRKFLAFGSAVSFSIFVLITRPSLENSWTSSGLLPTLTVTIATFAVVYMGSMLVLNLITNVWVLHRILGEKELNVNPLHPDRCGGLRPLSDYSLKTAYLAAILGIMVGLIEYQFITQGNGRVYWFAHLIIPLHIALSIACFFGPLLAAHRGMRKAKEELLHEIARQFQKDYAQIHTDLTKDAETFKKGTEKINELRAFYTLTNEFPVWPFDVQTFRRFLLTVPSPLLPLLPKLIEILLKRWGI
jgi:type III secretory pathway component EscS